MERIEKISIVIGLSFLVFLSGCVDNGFTSDGETEGPDDVVEVGYSNVVPSPPISAGSTFTYEFVLQNPYGDVDDVTVEAEDVIARVYDTGRCTLISDAEKPLGTLYPGAALPVKWEFEAPSRDRLAHVRGRCNLRFMVDYKYDAHTYSEIIVASEERQQEAAMAGEDITVSPSVSKSEGPIKIDVTFGGVQPFVEDTTTTASIVVRNVGDGHLRDYSINRDDIDISIEDVSNFSCEYPDDDEGVIRFYDRETPVIRCELELSPQDNPLETFHLRIDIEDYDYRVEKQKEVDIKL